MNWIISFIFALILTTGHPSADAQDRQIHYTLGCEFTPPPSVLLTSQSGCRQETPPFYSLEDSRPFGARPRTDAPRSAIHSIEITYMSIPLFIQGPAQGPKTAPGIGIRILYY